MSPHRVSLHLSVRLPRRAFPSGSPTLKGRVYLLSRLSITCTESRKQAFLTAPYATLTGRLRWRKEGLPPASPPNRSAQNTEMTIIRARGGHTGPPLQNHRARPRCVNLHVPAPETGFSDNPITARVQQHGVSHSTRRARRPFFPGYDCREIPCFFIFLLRRYSTASSLMLASRSLPGQPETYDAVNEIAGSLTSVSRTVSSPV